MEQYRSKCKLRYNIKEDLGGSLEVKFFSGPLVDFLGDGPYFIVRYESDVSSLGDVLSDEFVGIFDRSFLPRAVGVCEIDRYTQFSWVESRVESSSKCNFLISYCHLSQVLIAKGTLVRPGDIIAITGSTGRSTGPHLHLTCKYKGKALDPSVLLEYIQTLQQQCLDYLSEATNTPNHL